MFVTAMWVNFGRFNVYLTPPRRNVHVLPVSAGSSIFALLRSSSLGVRWVETANQNREKV